MSSTSERSDALRALAAAVVPGLAEDATPGAEDIGAEVFIGHYLPEPDLGGLELDPKPADSDLSEAAASPDVVQRLARRVDCCPGLRHATLLAIAAVYSSWSGTDGRGNLVGDPLGWSLAGYDGPARGRGPLGA
ncbi:MAG: hypothetical protein ACLGH3_05240 [Actinomycetota bacterium]